MSRTISEAISVVEARRIYDWLGKRHDMGARFERAAKLRALDRLDLQPGLTVLNAGIGTGKEQVTLLEAVAPAGVAVGVDISPIMLDLTRERMAHMTRPPLVRADIRRLPFAAGVFDRLFCAYVLDLIPNADVPVVLAEFFRVLKSGGRLVNVSLTEGTTLASRLVMGVWKAVYRVSPIALGGCRPVRLSHALLRAGFSRVEREPITQLGVPSEVLVTTRD